jgi:hypothetical protein
MAARDFVQNGKNKCVLVSEAIIMLWQDNKKRDTILIKNTCI